jgi:hypothetical protein
VFVVVVVVVDDDEDEDEDEDEDDGVVVDGFVVGFVLVCSAGQVVHCWLEWCVTGQTPD